MHQNKLWFTGEANIWEEAIPLGNGRLGAMVFGDPNKERIQLNEESMWYGGKVNRNNPKAKENLPHIREMLMRGQIKDAEELMCEALSGVPEGMKPYQTLGDLNFTFFTEGKVDKYERSLDLENAICTIEYQQGGVEYRREIFISKPADCMVIRMSANKPGSIGFRVELIRGESVDGTKTLHKDEIALYGRLGEGGVEYTMNLKASALGGTMSVEDNALMVQEADEVLLLFGADTTYQRFGDTAFGMDESWSVLTIMWEGLEEKFKSCLEQGYATLKEEHVKDYKALYDRLTFTLEGEDRKEVPTDVRIAESGDKEDLGLAKLYFDYGRYLLISCSRKDGLPATLQGLWNKDLTPPWDSKYTININMEMNYWPAEAGNLSECHMPMFHLLEKMVANGRVTARDMYGCRGFVAHHNTDIHGDTAPQDIWVPGTFWVMGAAWMCTHVWSHYQYTKDVKFLAKYYPICCEAALFFLDFLVGYKGYKVTCPSVSPENTFVLPNGQKGANGVGVTMDNQILRDLFTQCLKGYEVLRDCDDWVSRKLMLEALEEAGISDLEIFLRKVKYNLDRLVPTQISERGTILEWMQDYEEWEPGHRHISHLYGLHPSEQITMDGTPELAKAAGETLKARLSCGGGHTGWSRAWILNHYAKLWDGDECYEHLRLLFSQSTYPNMFDKHPPFQIDGNFGATGAMMEMIVQSGEERIVLLPALPSAWKSGSMDGLRVKGNGSLSISWNEGELVECRITADSDMRTKVRYKDSVMELVLNRNESKVITAKDFIIED